MKIIRKLFYNENTKVYSVELGESNKETTFTIDDVKSLNTYINYYGYTFCYMALINNEYYLCSAEETKQGVILRELLEQLD